VYHDGTDNGSPKKDVTISMTRLAALKLVDDDNTNNKNRWIWPIEYVWQNGTCWNFSISPNSSFFSVFFSSRFVAIAFLWC
jgi:hypothetical protein